jgi:hypothetical protein
VAALPNGPEHCHAPGALINSCCNAVFCVLSLARVVAYDEIVLCPAQLQRSEWWRNNATIIVVVATLLVLAIHPIAECVKCEFPNPWGRDDAAYLRDVRVFDAWLVVASFLAGLLGLRRSWLVPIGITMADIATQPIGGVSFFSLVNNEGPMMLLVGLTFGIPALSAGLLFRMISRWLQGRRLKPDLTL